MNFIKAIIEKAWQSGTLIGLASCALVPCCEFWIEFANDTEIQD